MTDGTRIGIIGTGRMGTAFAKRLAGQSWPVTVWNRSQDATATSAEAGARVANSIADLCDASDILISSLKDFEALEGVFSDAQGLAGQDLSGKLVIEMSTILPDEQVHLAERISGLGATYLECPVGGTVGPALKGQLLGFAGGDDAVDLQVALGTVRRADADRLVGELNRQRLLVGLRVRDDAVNTQFPAGTHDA